MPIRDQTMTEQLRANLFERLDDTELTLKPIFIEFERATNKANQCYKNGHPFTEQTVAQLLDHAKVSFTNWLFSYDVAILPKYQPQFEQLTHDFIHSLINYLDNSLIVESETFDRAMLIDYYQQGVKHLRETISYGCAINYLNTPFDKDLGSFSLQYWRRLKELLLKN